MVHNRSYVLPFLMTPLTVKLVDKTSSQTGKSLYNLYLYTIPGPPIVK